MENPRPQAPALTPPMAPLPVPIHPPIAPIPVPPPRVPAPAPAAAASMASTPTPSTGDGGEAEYEVSDDHRAARERHERAVQELLQRRRAYAMAVPTNDSAVRARLRRLGEPITLFGEREMERRDRLRALMVRLEADGQVDRLLRAQEDDQAARIGEEEEEEQIEYPFFTEGSQELLKARLDIARYSLPRAKARIERAKRRHEDPDEDPEAEAELVVKQAGEFVLECSEIGDDRPLTGCSFSRDASMLATRGRSGAAARAISLSHQVVGAKQFLCICGGRRIVTVYPFPRPHSCGSLQHWVCPCCNFFVGSPYQWRELSH
ncbi:COMPASS-like H3K4 histone methylase component WDR5B [Zea mays]|uniref:COMPASS-like H3K4 histone methylase component WDR5B n=1 Tax=Zea mays TaxID=4577 RepID=A0A1D6K3B6_MAIZE|nr:COMPASS-like H3K4 histone methylase component WDR5B [Zea mays]ONL98140.1 COMPASS-like H3K4 histone methylase component WDR5B [Zea mays]